MGESFSSKDTQRGIEQEPFARMEYEQHTGEIVREAGFAYLPTIMAGCSVDGFVGDEGIVEIKCPRTATHVSYLLGGSPPKEYIPQMRHNLWVTERTWCDFVSYDPTLPKGLRLFVARYEPSRGDILMHESDALRFLFRVKDIETQLREKMQ